MPLVESRKAPRVCVRGLSVDFSGGSSFPVCHGIDLTSGRARRPSRASTPSLRTFEAELFPEPAGEAAQNAAPGEAEANSWGAY